MRDWYISLPKDVFYYKIQILRNEQGDKLIHIHNFFYQSSYQLSNNKRIHSKIVRKFNKDLEM